MAVKLLWLALAGALGTLARYGTGVLVQRHATGYFPWPTFAVNMAGCFLFGAFYAFADERSGWTGETRLVVLTGFMGADTTYSAFAYDTAAFIRESQWLLAATNILAQNVLGVALLLIGIFVGKLL